MVEVFTLDAGERAALARHHGGRGLAMLGVAVANPARAEELAPVLSRFVAAVEASAAVGAALAASEAVPGPATMVALRDREAAWRDIADRYGLLTARDVAAAAGSRAGNANEYASAMARSGRAVAIRRANRLLFPAFQFDANGRPLPVVKDLLAVFANAGWSAESVVLWCTAPNAWSDGAEPAQRLADQADAVLAAARNAAADW